MRAETIPVVGAAVIPKDGEDAVVDDGAGEVGDAVHEGVDVEGGVEGVGEAVEEGDLEGLDAGIGVGGGGGGVGAVVAFEGMGFGGFGLAGWAGGGLGGLMILLSEVLLERRQRPGTPMWPYSRTTRCVVWLFTGDTTMNGFQVSRFRPLCFVALLFAIALNGNGQSGQVYFQTTTFGMVGLGHQQVARLNVLNPGNAYGDHTPVCSAELAFVDDRGHDLKTSTAQVDWGKAASLEFEADSTLNSAHRVEVRAVVRSFINPPPPGATSTVMPGAVCSFMPTLEVFDKETGKTVLVLSEGRSIVLNTPKNSIPKPPTP